MIGLTLSTALLKDTRVTFALFLVIFIFWAMSNRTEGPETSHDIELLSARGGPFCLELVLDRFDLREVDTFYPSLT